MSELENQLTIEAAKAKAALLVCQKELELERAKTLELRTYNAEILGRLELSEIEKRTSQESSSRMYDEWLKLYNAWRFMNGSLGSLIRTAKEIGDISPERILKDANNERNDETVSGKESAD